MSREDDPFLPWEFPGEKPSPPDFSALPKFAEPKDDNERLMNYQWVARNGDRAAYDGMYELGRQVALRLIAKEASGNRHVAELGAAEREEKAHNAITYIVERFLRSDGFFIKKSFTAYIYLRVRHELYYRRKVDEIVRFVDPEKITIYKEAKL